MKITIIDFNNDEEDLKKIYSKFVKRIEFFSSVNFIILKEKKEVNIDKKKHLETLEIIKNIPKNSKVFLFTINSRQPDSIEFSKTITNEANITLIIGGSNGVDKQKLEQEINNLEKISFSKLTFPHKIFKLLVLEQIYRAFCIQKNIKYHK
ncbi:23S rRNA (pseudouridine(1915)-N(3))-methyltransferase RlmH [Mesomycoplasma hyorhinis]|uniref:23S rRNA (pseudouridine(1915)-N(3))-methyltransferase RlmH n=1 Tax=Mesomycoplasma hyorhinis TaxID=2100 RepID=UPI001C052AEA|nr:23S rRNA (pseudouridine(1915)-N(3))-methyltransferase RlmH [Mesomycoplasma hyorhinis]UVT34321.1 23S rRNA (pseudouridine(1915)-N(3))-methyltransferase RlmH [Mesomycoplasma hyorhinis]